MIVSETMKPVTAPCDFGGTYSDVTLLRESPRSRLYVALRSGRRFLLKAPGSTSGHDLSMLKREYELSLTLSSPYLAYVFVYEPESPVGPCMVMEYVDGQTLDSWLLGNPDLSERRRIFSQLLDAVSYIHSRGILHNDLAPQNILITRADSNVKLIDFGFADDAVHYMDKSLGTTRDYASPELVEGRQTDVRSDIWSLGMIMRDIFGYRRYSRVSARCTRTNPSDRYPTVEALRRALSRHRRLPAVVTAVAAVAALLAGVVIAIHQHDRIDVLETIENERIEQETECRSEVEMLEREFDEWYDKALQTLENQVTSGADEQVIRQLKKDNLDGYQALMERLQQTYPDSYLDPDFWTHISEKDLGRIW